MTLACQHVSLLFTEPDWSEAGYTTPYIFFFFLLRCGMVGIEKLAAWPIIETTGLAHPSKRLPFCTDYQHGKATMV